MYEQDKEAIALLKGSHNLRKLVLRSCLRIGDRTAEAAVAHCTQLEVLNVNFTSITSKGLGQVIGGLGNLEVLKVASINGLTDARVMDTLSQATDMALRRGVLPLAKLRSLKLKSTGISDVGVGRFLSMVSPTLESLDISFTAVRTLDFLIATCFSSTAIAHNKLRKLNLSGLTPKAGSLKKLFAAISNAPPDVALPLEKLKLGSIGATLLATAGSNDFVDSKLIEQLRLALLRCPHLFSLSLFGNERICNSSGMLAPLLTDLSERIRVRPCAPPVLALRLRTVSRPIEHHPLELDDIPFEDDRPGRSRRGRRRERPCLQDRDTSLGWNEGGRRGYSSASTL
jgi:hypothetical protein